MLHRWLILILAISIGTLTGGLRGGNGLQSTVTPIAAKCCCCGGGVNCRCEPPDDQDTSTVEPADCTIGQPELLASESASVTAGAGNRLPHGIRPICCVVPCGKDAAPPAAGLMLEGQPQFPLPSALPVASSSFSGGLDGRFASFVPGPVAHPPAQSLLHLNCALTV